MTQTKAELLQTRHQGDIRLGDADSSHYVGFKAPATVGSNLVWTLPATDGSANQFLQTNASGVLGWGTADVSSAMPLSGGTFTGDVTFDGATAGRDIVFDRSDNALEFADNAKLKLGSSGDLLIEHDGSNSYIQETGTGNLFIDASIIYLRNAAGDEHLANFNSDGAVNLYHNGVLKLATSSSGVAITGAATVSTNLIVTGNLTVSGTTTTVDSVTLSVKDKNIEMGVVSSPSDTTADGGGITLKGASDKTFNWVNSTDAWTSSEHIHLGDNKKVLLGTGSDFQSWHDGSNSYITNTTGNIVIQAKQTESSITAIADGAVELYHNNAKKFETTSGGINVTGAITVGGSPLSSAPTVDLVADGAISNNVACNITSAGKVEAITASAAGANFIVSGQDVNNYEAFSWDSEHKLFCCFYKDDSDEGLYLKVGTPSGLGTSQTITWGSSQLLYSDAQANSGGYSAFNYIGASYHPGAKFHVVCWRPAGLWSIAVQINSSGNVTIKGSPNHFTGGTGNSVGNVAPRLCPSETDTNVTLVFYKGSSNSTSVKYRNLTITTNNGTTAESGESGFMANGNWSNHSVWSDSTNSNTLIAARNGSNGIYYGLLYSGGDTQQQINGASDSRPAICHDPVSDKIVVFYHDASDGGNNNDLRYMIGTYNSSHNSVSWGSEQTAITNNVHSDGWSGDMNNYVTYDSLNKKFYLAYKQSNPQKVFLLPFTIHSGGSAIVTETAIEVKDSGWQTLSPFADVTTGNVYVGMTRPSSESGSGQGESEPGVSTYFVASTSVDTQNFLGWSSAAASDGNTATIKVVGNTVTGLSSLTPGKQYYVQSDGSVGLTPITGKSIIAGTALTSSSLLINPGR